MKKSKLYQQGDVLLKLVGAVPVKSRRVDPGPRGFVLAEGEHTGHAHVVDALEHVSMAEVEEGIRYLEVREAVELRHEEHHAIRIEPGIYEIGRVVEVDPFSREIREVAD